MTLVLALAACGGAPASVRPATPAASGVVSLDATEYAFAPAAATVPAGQVSFAVHNAGKEPHEFEVLQGDQSLGKVPAFPVGATGSLTVTLEPGAYTFACRLNGHDQLGMKGSLIVAGS